MGDTVLYINFEQNNEVSGKTVTIGDIAEVFCENKSIERKVKDIVLVKIGNVKKQRYIFSMITVLKRISDVAPKVQVENIGESEFIIDYMDDRKSQTLRTVLKYASIIFICILTFCGGAFTIIAYNNDVDMHGIMDNFNTFFKAGDRGKDIMEFMYSLGVGTGIIIFFNHFGGKKITTDPTPIEVEMTSYEKAIDAAVIDRSNESAKKSGKKGKN